MLGSDESRGYMLEMPCADFLAGAQLDSRVRKGHHHVRLDGGSVLLRCGRFGNRDSRAHVRRSGVSLVL